MGTIAVYDRRGKRLGTVYLGCAPEEKQPMLSTRLTGASALGSLLSGVAFGQVGYPFIGVTVAAIALVPLALGWRLATSRVEAQTA